MASALKMKKGLKNSLCSGRESVATLISKNCKQPVAFSAVNLSLRERLAEKAEPTRDEVSATTPSVISSYYDSILTNEVSEDDLSPPPTLEEMLARLDEEEEQRQLQLAGHFPSYNYGDSRSTVPMHHRHGLPYYDIDASRRMSSVNNSEILRAARNALNQYPRFSLDGRDALHRPSFEFVSRMDLPRKSFCVKQEMGTDPDITDFRRKYCHAQSNPEAKTCIPNNENNQSSTNVKWRQPGLIARLMGLERMPINSTSSRPQAVHKIILPKSSANASKASTKPAGAMETVKDPRLQVSSCKEQHKPEQRRYMVQHQSKPISKQDQHLKHSRGSSVRQQGLNYRQKPYDYGTNSKQIRSFSSQKSSKPSCTETHVRKKTVGLQGSSSSSSSSVVEQQRSYCKAVDIVKPINTLEVKNNTRTSLNGLMRRPV
eukprot:Gb_01265 [translate_table: standard]